MKQNKKWVIVEYHSHNNSKNTIIKHRTKMKVACIIHIQGLGLKDTNTGEIYNYAFENRQFKTKEEAILFLGVYFKDELAAIDSMFKCIINFKNQHPELII